MTKTLDERIEETKGKISQYENQIKRLTQRQTEAERKARTRRLIERGALLESFLPEPEALTNEQVKEILANHMPPILIAAKQREGASHESNV